MKAPIKTKELSEGNEAYLKRLKRSAKEAKEIKAGIRKGKSLDDFLKEL